MTSSQNIEIDSAYDTDSYTSYTTSLRPSIMEYKVENGRRYHAYREGKYLFPNDEEELDRLDLQNHLWRMTLDGKLCLAPIPESLSSSLDLATGTGI